MHTQTPLYSLPALRYRVRDLRSRAPQHFLIHAFSFLDAAHTQTPLPFLTAPPGRSWCRARDYAATLRSRALPHFLARFFPF